MKNKSMINPLLLLIFILLQITSCGTFHPGARQLAIDLTKQLKDRICHTGYVPSQPCSGKDVRFDADLGAAVYINIYGINNEKEVEMLANFAANFRDERDKSIPVYLSFYGDLTKSRKIKSIEIKGS
jgi:hypothetical protein